MATPPRSAQSRLFSLVLVAGALLMAFLGSMAAGYFAPAACLLLLAALIWLGRGVGLVKAVAVVNIISGLVLVLALALGGGLGDVKLDISGMALLANLATGGPVLSLVAAPLLVVLRGRSAQADA